MPSTAASPCATCAATAWNRSRRLEKDHKISQDEHRQKSDEVQKLTDRYVKQVDEVLAHKEKRDQDRLMSTASLPAAAGPDAGSHHVAIIMDGNGRWAKARGLPRVAGHRRGADAVRRVVRGAGELGIPVLTLFAFSTENWTRPADEVNDLMGLLRHYLRNELEELHKNGARLRVIGNRDGLAADIVRDIAEAQKMTQGQRPHRRQYLHQLRRT